MLVQEQAQDLQLRGSGATASFFVLGFIVEPLCVFVAMSKMMDFLESVDANRGRKPDGFFDAIEAALTKNMFFEPEDLVGAKVGSIQVSCAGYEAFIERAVKKANALAAPRVEQSVSGEFDSTLALRDLMPVVHVDMHTKLLDVSLAVVPQALWPKGKATDNLATWRAKLVKKGIARPFPDTDLVQFVLGWCNVKSIMDECREEREFESESDGRGRLARDKCQGTSFQGEAQYQKRVRDFSMGRCLRQVCVGMCRS